MLQAILILIGIGVGTVLVYGTLKFYENIKDKNE
jgi:hypothetical protein